MTAFWVWVFVRHLISSWWYTPLLVSNGARRRRISRKMALHKYGVGEHSDVLYSGGERSSGIITRWVGNGAKGPDI